MSRRITALALSLLAAASLGHRAEAGGLLSTPLQTQSIPMTQTNWGPGVGGVAGPLHFQAFDPHLGTLEAVNITLAATIRNDFLLVFEPTPIITTIYAATTQATSLSVLSDPIAVQSLTDGPTITLTAPDQLTSIFGAPATRMPVDVISMAEVSGTWSSLLPVTDPNFIPPTQATFSLSQAIDASHDPGLMPSFIGTGTIDLPITATAHSSVFSSTMNGGGGVFTSADATVTVQYQYFAIPEPSGLILLGLGVAIPLLAVGRRHRAHADRPGGRG